MAINPGTLLALLGAANSLFGGKGQPPAPISELPVQSSTGPSIDPYKKAPVTGPQPVESKVNAVQQVNQQPKEEKEEEKPSWTKSLTNPETLTALAGLMRGRDIPPPPAAPGLPTSHFTPVDANPYLIIQALRNGRR